IPQPAEPAEPGQHQEKQASLAVYRPTHARHLEPERLPFSLRRAAMSLLARHGTSERAARPAPLFQFHNNALAGSAQHHQERPFLVLASSRFPNRQACHNNQRWPNVVFVLSSLALVHSPVISFTGRIISPAIL